MEKERMPKRIETTRMEGIREEEDREIQKLIRYQSI
jgi:hypothetical protein